MNAHQYVYAVPTRKELGDILDQRLAAFTERHRVALTPPAPRAWRNPAEEMQRCGAHGVVLEMVYGCPRQVHLRLARSVLAANGRVFFYWPREQAVECIDRERLSSYWRLWLVVRSAYLYLNIKRLLWSRPIALVQLLRALWLARACVAEAGPLAGDARPAPLRLERAPSAGTPLPGLGVYLRTDFWAGIDSGGSYGHTCYVARELAASTEKFTAFMGHRYAMLDEMGVNQVPLPLPSTRADEHAFLSGNRRYLAHLREELARLRPRYIYERLCLGNYVGAKLSLELGIPYIVEYNGSEVSMLRSFNSRRYVCEHAYLAAELAAFRQASAISVVSDAVREDLLKRGVDAAKILVNPNGVDVDAYAPPPPPARLALRHELGFGPDDRVICFTGTFGGWHGVEVLAAAMPRILAAVPQARFLLIGDGSYKHLVDKAVEANGLESRVKRVGRVPQAQGARLLGAADIYVSPHSSHMVDSRFFGSPTKIFEYMGMGGGIVASALEQIGEVLSPGLVAARLPGEAAQIGQERAILCEPGNVDEFVAAVIYAAKSPEVCSALGRNARAAAASEFSWRRHVERLWQFVHARGL